MQNDLLPRVDHADEADDGAELFDVALPLVKHLKLLVAGPLLAGLAALGASYLIPPTSPARTTLLPPQQQQSSAASALGSLGALAGIAGGALGGLSSIKSPTEQYVALIQSRTVADRIIDKFELLKVYDEKLNTDARKELEENVHVAVGRKDGLITIEVDDKDPKRAAA